MAVLDNSPSGFPLPHPDNNPYAVDVPRLREAIILIDAKLVEITQALGGVPGVVESEVAPIREMVGDLSDEVGRLQQALLVLAAFVETRVSQDDFNAFKNNVDGGTI